VGDYIVVDPRGQSAGEDTSEENQDLFHDMLIVNEGIYVHVEVREMRSRR